ncbi:MAG: ADP-glyceromanno-heptose 6-epimerase [Acidimicrobiales bacterium]|nr:ADP-glyceromanno-heptose 6-epimerase [Acidimicrobiales bacterium]
MIVVTGGSGFIGSNLVRSLVLRGGEVLVVDDVDARGPGGNLQGVAIADQVGQEEFRRRIEVAPTSLRGVEAVLHQGACSSTTEDDEAFLVRNNLEYSCSVLEACLASQVPLVYASSASVYGTAGTFDEQIGAEQPLNGYARSKARFDQAVAVRAADPGSPLVGLRYFHDYGTGEDHKGAMASQVLQLADQIDRTGVAHLFGAGAGADAGQHRRDFVHVDDVVAVVHWFLDHPDRSGIFNCGTGTSRTFEELATVVIGVLGRGRIEYVPFPASLQGRYQADTRADLRRLRSAGCDHRFAPVEQGIGRFLAARGPG